MSYKVEKNRTLGTLESKAQTVLNSAIDQSIAQARVEILEPLPNDVTRIIYLASLRDYNSGIYLHPHLSQQHDLSIAHRALQACHQDIFRQLLESQVRDYVQQLKVYIRYAGAREEQFISTWDSLKAYRAAIPADALPITRDLFFLNVDTALAILKSQR